ncbi:hypothetical protein EE612_036606 [Oryza sativa]|nr:hypothetical protein EE612_036606 [Oryza sativa]
MAAITLLRSASLPGLSDALARDAAAVQHVCSSCLPSNNKEKKRRWILCSLKKTRYKNFDELYMYCYYVAGTVGLMSVPVMGIAPESKATTESVYSAALALGIANQLTNILRDVGEDARRGRIYLPQDELAEAGLSDEDIFNGVVTNKWRSFMKRQIKRARMFFEEAERGVTELSQASRWPVWASLLLYRQILDEIEANDYNNFTKRAYVGKAKKLLALPVAYGRSLLMPYSLRNSQK